MRAALGAPPPIDSAILESLRRRLRPGSPRPVAVGLSGGGDSLALLLAATTWARRVGRELLVLTVDHRLQPQSATWTQACGERAARLGLAFRALAWDGPKPRHGLPAAARTARHRLLADAAREAGARVILLGHTADDVLEARAMREAGSTTPEPREWTPSPAWPHGRGVFLLRPMLALRRAALRDWLGAQGETWLEDPANADLRFARPRARAALAPGADRPGIADEAAPLALAADCAPLPGGGFAIARARIRDASPQDGRRLTALACVCAGGGERLPSAASVDRLAAAVRGTERVSATLAGARVLASPSEVLFVREAGEAARGGLPELAVPAGRAIVWDGRFELRAEREGLRLRRLAGLAARLPAGERRPLAELPAAVRPSLPVLETPQGEISCPLLASQPGVTVTALTHPRLLAAAGLITAEPD